MKENSVENKSLPKCGIIMPISAIDNCSTEHWSEVLSIIRDITIDSGFEPNLVSDADESGIIQKRIIQNIYSNEIVICDVSCKNPNVMFELGLRLAFDKPTIIIKDDITDYSFDTSVIEHLSYPRDLRFNKIISFKENLKKKIQSTYQKSINDPNYSTFLKNFGEYKIAHLSEKEITSDKYMLNLLEEMKYEIHQVRRNQSENLIEKRNIKILDKNDPFVWIDRNIAEFLKLKKINSKTRINEKLKEELKEYIYSKDEAPHIFQSEFEVNVMIDRVLELPF